jgi:hypothetical protein
METNNDIWLKLAAPLLPDTIAWRQDGKVIQRDGKFFARFVCYVEAGTVRERLDSVVPGGWDLTLEPLPNRDVLGYGGEVDNDQAFAFKARLQVLGVMREDVGVGKDYKQSSTDAFKRAAVRFGIGHELYNMEQLWVEMDGDGKYAKPVEDPQKVYERKHGVRGEARSQSASTSVSATPPRASNPNHNLNTPSQVADALEPPCPKCGGRVWDNRLTKKNPKAPDYKCRNRSCDGVIWPSKEGEAVSRTNDGDPPAMEDGYLSSVDESELPF